MTNLEEGRGGQVYKYMVAVLQELLLPPSEQTPPFSRKYSPMVDETFRSGVVDRRLFGEETISGRDVKTECKLRRLYEEVACRLCCEEELYTYPPCRDGERYTFTRCQVVARKKETRFCCVPPSCYMTAQKLQQETPAMNLHHTLDLLAAVHANQASACYRPPYELPRLVLSPLCAAQNGADDDGGGDGGKKRVSGGKKSGDGGKKNEKE